MLINEPAILTTKDPILQILAAATAGTPTDEKWLQTGVYQIGHFNANHLLPHGLYDEYPEIGYGSYGVCDSLENLLEKVPELVESDRLFVVTLTSIRRENQSPEGGWRWHKWGEYIGNQNPEHEYIYDDKHIDEVFCYHIFEKVKIIPVDQLEHGAYYSRSGLCWPKQARWNADIQRFITVEWNDESQLTERVHRPYSQDWADYRSQKIHFAPIMKVTGTIHKEIELEAP